MHQIDVMKDFEPSQSISTRPVTPDDDQFLRRVYKSSRGDDLRGLQWDEDRIDEFLEMQYDAERKFFENDYRKASNQIVALDGQPAGRLIIERREHEIRCVDISLLPEHRNQGVGTFIINTLQSEATAANLPLRMQVIRFNRAVNLFERMGFVRTSETGTHFQMEWLP